MQLGWIDQLVLITSILLAILIGLVMRGKASSVEAFLLGDRNLPWWAILGSIVATETSTATVLSLPGQSYGATGARFLQIAIGLIAGRIIVVFVLLPLFFDGKLFSAYEVLERRFGVVAKFLASTLFLVTRNLGDGLRLFLAAMVIEKLVGWSFVSSALTIGTVTILYTYFGGMRSVVWNDCIQLCIYLFGAVATVWIIARLIPGGWPEFWQFAKDTGKLDIFQFAPPDSLAPDISAQANSTESNNISFLQWLVREPYSFWAGLFGGALLTLGTHGTDQMMVQRYLSARSQRQAGWAIFLSGIVVFLQFALFLFIGVQLACFYSTQPLLIEKADEVYAHFIINSFPYNTGLVGIMLAAILAAAMSTLSSSLNASASAVVNDFYLSGGKRDISPESLLKITRWLAVGFGCLQIAIGIWAVNLDSTVISSALTIAGYAAGLLLGLFALALFNRRANQWTAVVGATVGLTVLLLAQFVAPKYNFPIAWTWFAMIGSISTYIAGSIAAAIFPISNNKAKVQPR